MQDLNQNQKLFSLVELTIAMGILISIFSLAIVTISIFGKAQRNTRRTDLAEHVEQSIIGYKRLNGSFPLTNQVKIIDDELVIEGPVNTVLAKLSGVTLNSSLGRSDSKRTAYCYRSDFGMNFSFGVDLENNSWGLQVGSDQSTCDENYLL